MHDIAFLVFKFNFREGGKPVGVDNHQVMKLPLEILRQAHSHLGWLGRAAKKLFNDVQVKTTVGGFCTFSSQVSGADLNTWTAWI